MVLMHFYTGTPAVRSFDRLLQICTLIGVLLMYSCAGQKNSPSAENLASGVVARPESSSTEEAIAFNLSSDSIRIHFRIPENQLLFVREDSAFSADLEVTYSLFLNARAKQALDTGRVRFNMRAGEPGKGFSGFFDLKLSFQGYRLLRLAFVDVHKKQTRIVRLSLARNPSSLVQQDFLLLEQNDRVITSNALPVGSCVRIRTPSIRSDSVWVRWYLKRFPLPSLPFRVIPDPVFSLVADTACSVPVSALSDFCLDRIGVCFIQEDTLSSGGCSIVVCDPDFPNVSGLDQLIEGTRYLTTKSEYRDLNRPGDRKTTFDSFWLEVGGSADRARRLIRVYYNRMQEANRRFTSFTPGWRTDRGMVYMVFGEPQTVYNDGETEQWNYPAQPGIPDQYFIFRKMGNPFSDNDYALIRQPQLEWTWYSAVDQWRNGRIRQDD
jgi:GWxTD domain-containing protein